MNDEKWADLADSISDKFGIKEITKEEVEESDDRGSHMKATVDAIYFIGPAGEMKLERYTRPKILDKKVHYSRTQGSGGQVEYVLSEDEFVHKVKAYKLNPLSGEYEELTDF